LSTLQRFVSLKKLTLGGPFSKSSALRLPPQLQTLHFSYGASQLQFEGVRLPASLTEWHFVHEGTSPRSLEQVELPHGLRSLLLQRYRFPLPNLERTALRSLRLHSVAACAIDSLRLPPSLGILVAPSDLGLRLSDSGALSSFFALHRRLTALDLTHCSSDERTDLRSLTWPLQLAVLRFGRQWQQSLTAAEWSPPATLTELRLPSGNQFWQQRCPGAVPLLFPPHLCVLHICNAYEDGPSGFRFPSLKGIAIPLTVRVLCIALDTERFGGRMLVADWPPLPPLLEELHAGDWFNGPIDSLPLPAALRALSLGRHFNQPLGAVCFPSSLQQFTVASDCFDQPLEQLPRFPHSLRVFATFRHRLNLLQQLQLPPQCVVQTQIRHRWETTNE
jgi:hypothetical protein